MGIFGKIYASFAGSRRDGNDYPVTPGGPVATCFADPSYNAMLARDGVATFPWLDAAKIERLKQIVEHAGENVDFDGVHIPTRFRLSAFNNDSSYKTRLYDDVYAFLKSDLEALLPGYEPLVINVFEKLPGRGADEVPIHQNPSFVDEPRFKSVSIWVPLQDVGRHNGTIGVLRGSHGRFNTMRAGNMRHEEIFEQVASKLERECFEPMELKAGEVAVVDDSIVHWSYPNTSDQPRVAVQLIMVPSAAEHIYYYYNEAGEKPVMDLYEVDKTFFFEFNCKELPEGLRKVGSVPYEYRQITDRQLFGKTRG